MKKFLVSSLVLLMTALSLDAGIAVHYCGGELAQMKVVIGHGTATCGMEPAEKRDDRQQKIDAVPCCQDELRLIQVDDYQSSCPVCGPSQRLPLFETGTAAGSVLLGNPTVLWVATRYRPPSDLNGVSLPFLQVFLI